MILYELHFYRILFLNEISCYSKYTGRTTQGYFVQLHAPDDYSAADAATLPPPVTPKKRKLKMSGLEKRSIGEATGLETPKAAN